jgi:hypothetical protein
MDSWDTLFPFTGDEINLFSRLHQKVTKFPGPIEIKERKTEEFPSAEIAIFSSSGSGGGGGDGDGEEK